MLAKFYGNILNLSENIAKSFRGGLLFLTHTVEWFIRVDAAQLNTNDIAGRFTPSVLRLNEISVIKRLFVQISLAFSDVSHGLL